MDSKIENRLGKRVKNNTITEITEIGRIIPQATDLEQAILGAMLLDKNAVNDTIDVLRKDSFYDPKNQLIFGAIHDLFSQSEPIDLLTVISKLKSRGELELAGGVTYVSTLTKRIASSANAEYHARIVAQKSIQREIIRMCNEILKDAYDETADVFELLEKAEKDLFAIAENNMKKGVDEMKNVLREALEEITEANKNQTGISGIPSGFRKLDEMTSGWQRSDMIVIAARPAMGKTAFVLSMARNMAVDYKKAVAIFSLEMSSVQLVKRLISAETRIPAEKLRKGDLRNDELIQLQMRISSLTEAPIFIDDTPGLNVFDLRAKCRRLKMQKNIEMVIIDYLQLMSGGAGTKNNGNREQEISSISRAIKGIAKELNVPVIALSQLSRSVETRGGDKRPILSDLRESGAIEQDADIVGFLYRPKYYGITEYEDGQPTDGIGEVILAKHRNGAVGNIRLRFIGEFARFDNLEDSGIELDTISSGNALMPSRSFESSSNSDTYTVQSKMNSNAGFSTDDFNFDQPSEDAF